MIMLQRNHFDAVCLTENLTEYVLNPSLIRTLHQHDRPVDWYFYRLKSMCWGYSSVVERMLCMYEAPGSIPGISTRFLPFTLPNPLHSQIALDEHNFA
jgi:hypothetical protein